MGNTHSLIRWRWFLILAALEIGAVLVGWLLLHRGGTLISPFRSAVALVLALGAVGAAALALKPAKLRACIVSRWATPTAVATGFVAALALFLLRYLDPSMLLPYYQRLSGLLGLILVLSIQAGALLLIERGGLDTRALADSGVEFRPALTATAALLAVMVFVGATRLGLTPDSAYWAEPGVPILGWQLMLAAGLGLAVLLVGARARHMAHLDAIVAIGVWLLAVLVWLSVPLGVLQNSFYAPIRPPSDQPFPNSDAAYYDSMAHSLLIGYPYLEQIPSRPLYVVLLAVFHLLAGENYRLIIFGQTMLLALIPIALYLMGSALHSRSAGIIAGLAAIAREWTTLQVSSATRVSSTKTLLVDLPTLLAVLACCLLTIRWLEHKTARGALLAGGSFGLLILLRTQASIIFPLAILLWCLAFAGRRRALLGQLALFIGASLLTVLPWLARNYLVTGHVSMEAEFQYDIIASQYRYTGNLDIENVDLEGKDLLGTLFAFAARDPKFVLGFIANHALATQVGAVKALPLFHDYGGLSDQINLYWLDGHGPLTFGNWVLVVVYLCLIGLGLGSAWRRARWGGLVPLGFSLAYSLGNGVARFSGWRYDLPADWIAYFYLALGVAEVFILLGSLLGMPREALSSIPRRAEAKASGIFPAVSILVAFMLVGMLPWLGTLIAEPRYSGLADGELRQTLTAAPATRALGVSVADVETFADSPQAILTIGRVLYPRYFTRGLGLASTNPWPAFAPRDFPRLGFVLLNQLRRDVVLPIRPLPQEFEHGADAIVLGCNRADYLEARLILFVESGRAVAGPPLNQACP